MAKKEAPLEGQVFQIDTTLNSALVLIGIKSELEAISLESKDITADSPVETIKQASQRLVKVRTSIEAKRKEIKAPFLDAGKKIDAYAKELTAICVPEEERVAAVLEEVSNKELARLKDINNGRVIHIEVNGGSVNGAVAGYGNYWKPVDMLYAVPDDDFEQFLSDIRTTKAKDEKDKAELEELRRLQQAQQVQAVQVPEQSVIVDPTPSPEPQARPVPTPVDVPQTITAPEINWMLLPKEEVFAKCEMLIESGESPSPMLFKALYMIATSKGEDF